VGPEFPAPFLAEDAINVDFFAPSTRAGHALFDLPGYISRKLAKLGVIEVTRVPADTCRDESRFFSYRRATLRGDADYGRQLSAIQLER
jgi:copper oxidase (laccase) domain-containing protein